jgi:hypothetical protein
MMTISSKYFSQALCYNFYLHYWILLLIFALETLNIKNMATREQIEALKIDENVFELVEDTELEYLVYFAAPFTGADKCLIPKGTAFAPHGPMRGDALYMHLVDDGEEAIYNKMEELAKVKFEDFFTRLQGFSFFITEEQLRTLPLKFRSGSAERLLEIMRKLRSPVYPIFT